MGSYANATASPAQVAPLRQFSGFNFSARRGKQLMPASHPAISRIPDLDPSRIRFLRMIWRILFLRYDPFEVDFAGFMEALWIRESGILA
jgi:hypothetical protein